MSVKEFSSDWVFTHKTLIGVFLIENLDGIGWFFVEDLVYYMDFWSSLSIFMACCETFKLMMFKKKKISYLDRTKIVALL